MNPLMRVSIWALSLTVLAAPAGAQWVNYPTPGIPRTADGKPNLEAPAPRTADGKPDLSGLWERTLDRFYFDAAADLKPEAVQPWAKVLYEQRKLDFGKQSMEARCLPFGPMYATTPFRETKIVQTPDLIVMLFEDLTHRQIFMDGRKLETDPNPSWMGYSVGHWEGDTLVIESNGFNTLSWLDMNGHPHTEALRVTERYRRRDFGHIDTEVTFDDPGAYAKPWTMAIPLNLMVDTSLLEYYCDNEKSLQYMLPVAQPKVATVSSQVLTRYVGSYEMANSGRPPDRVVLTLTDGKLFWNQNEGGEIELVPLSETTFVLNGSPVEFLRDDSGVYSRFHYTWVENTWEGKRK
jgi:hypothetical protein